MRPVSYYNLRSFIQHRETHVFKTLSRGKLFVIVLTDVGMKYIPDASGKPISQQQGSIEQAIERFRQIESFKAADYSDIFKHSQYLLAIINDYIESDYRYPGQSSIESIYIGNFKAIENLQKLPLKKITIIYGGNSSGKSSVIHSLLLANHAIQTGDLDVQCPLLAGDSVDLNGFCSYIHRSGMHYEYFEENERVGGDSDSFSVKDFNIKTRCGPMNVFQKGVSWGADMPAFLLPLGIRKYFPQQNTLTISININRQVYEKRVYDEELSRGGEVAIDDFLEKPKVCQYTISLDGKELFKLEIDELQGEYLVFTQVDNESGLRNYINDAIKAMIPQDLLRDVKFDSDFVEKTVKNYGLKCSGFIPQEVQLLPKEYTHNPCPAKSSGNTESSAKEISAKTTNILQSIIADQLSKFFMTISKIITERMGNLVYLGPLRYYYPRNLEPQNKHPNDGNWHSSGAYAWSALKNDDEVRASVNRWLGHEIMQTPYSFVRQRYEQERNLYMDLISIHGQFYKDLVESPSHWAKDVKRMEIAIQKAVYSRDWEVKKKTAAMVDKIFESHGLGKGMLSVPYRKDELILIDQRTKTEVSHRDVGFGISQLIPILCYSYAYKEKIIAIEQPEIHLHPALQSELADVFVESALGNNQNTFILESHSEHLLLRIMRRMRETHENKLPEGVPPVTPDDVAVLYVKPDGPRSVVLEMPLNEKGELVKPWPGGFFEEGFREVFPEDAC